MLPAALNTETNRAAVLGTAALAAVAFLCTFLAYKPKADEMLLTVHRRFADKSCPGDWLYSRLGALALQVTDPLSPKENSGVPGDGNISRSGA